MAIKQSVWEMNNYYKLAERGSLDVNHPGIKLLISLARNKKNILDLGCGEGTRLSSITKSGTGIDISEKAITLARKKYPRLKFVIGDLEKLPFKNESFDLVYSAYVFEHLENPKKVLEEAKRVLKKDGDLVMICPNYGAPNRASPPFRGSRIRKFFLGLFVNGTLDWNRVIPIANKGKYEMDWDVTIEPYSLSLAKFLNSNGFRIIKNIPTWDLELKDAKFHQKIFRLLGTIGVYPFSYWSPHIILQARKI